MMKYKNKENENISKATLGNSKVNRVDAHDYEKKIQDLSEKVEIAETKLKTTTEQKIKILSRLKDCEEENERMRDQIARQASTNQKLNEEIKSLNSQLNEMMNGARNLNEKCRTKFEILNKELEDKELHLEKVVSQLKAKDETIKYYSVNNEQTIRSQGLYKEELENSKVINKELEDKIRNLEKTIDELYVSRKSESALLLEIEHLKDDNVRLLKMLKGTEEFKDFAYLAENVSGGITFIRTSSDDNKKTKSLNTSKSVSKYNSINYSKNPNYPFNKECEKKKIESEDPFNGDNWVPLDAFKFTHDFKNKFNIEMSEPLINDLLGALNKIWRDRENKQISTLKTKYQTEIMTLRRKANMRNSYNEHTAVKTISRLKKDLQNVRDDLRSQIVEKNKLNRTPSGIDLVDNALKVASGFQKTKKVLENEITLLKKKLENQDSKNGENFERMKFNEGSFWMIGRVLDEINTLVPQLDELYTDFEDRIKNVANPNYSTREVLDYNAKMMTNSKKWYQQSMKETLEEVRNKFEKWQIDIQKNFENTSEELKVANLLGEDVDNPKITFRSIEGLLEKRIESLSTRMYQYVKDYDKDQVLYDNLDQEVNNDVDTIENEYFYVIKQNVETLHNDLDELDAYSLLLQKQITTLKKEKVDLIVQINALNLKLDNIEKDLGINIAAKRAKKKI